MEQDTQNLKNKWLAFSIFFFILAFLGLVLAVQFYYIKQLILIFPLGLVISLIFGITGLKNKENKKLSVALISLNSIIFVVIIILICLNLNSKPSVSRDAKIKAAMESLRPSAELYYDDNNNSYLGFENTDEVQRIRQSIENAKGSDFVLNINPKGTEYCSDVKLVYGGNLCVDSVGNYIFSTSSPKCSSNYYVCK
jgi:hypothetical protein